MGHTPYGYRIEKGQAVIDEVAAAVVQKLYKNYLSGMGLSAAAKEAGLDTYHATAKHIMQNRHYLGDDFYPAIIDKDSFDAVTAELARRAGKLGRLNKASMLKTKCATTSFQMEIPKKTMADPFQQAAYLYSLITEVGANG